MRRCCSTPWPRPPSASVARCRAARHTSRAPQVDTQEDRNKASARPCRRRRRRRPGARLRRRGFLKPGNERQRQVRRCYLARCREAGGGGGCLLLYKLMDVVCSDLEGRKSGGRWVVELSSGLRRRTRRRISSPGKVIGATAEQLFCTGIVKVLFILNAI